MEKKVDISSYYSGKTIAKNTIYNLLGYIAPLFVAIALIPLLIKGLGEERFGILNLAWIVIGYFSFFDFGIGRTLTKLIAEKLGAEEKEKIPDIFWTSFSLMFVVSILGGVLLVILTPTLVYHFFNISKDLHLETLNTFYILAISIPIVTTTAGLRGVLEAYQKFSIINIIRTILGIFTFLGPLLCLIFTENLVWVVAFLTIIRAGIWLVYFKQCLKLDIYSERKFVIKTTLIKSIIKLSSWMTVSNLIGPLIIYIDRFLIGALISATAITFYATPYEVITKLLLISGALSSVLFPAFSANYLYNLEFTKKILFRGIKYIFILLYPIILLIIAFAYEGMDFWLGEKFAKNSSLILQLFAIGILFNSIAVIPFTFLQGIGRPDITAKIHLVEFPIYLMIMWIAIKYFGINGAALIWLLRIVIDTLILFLFTKRVILNNFGLKFKINYISISIIIVSFLFVVLFNSSIVKFILVPSVILIFLLISWKYILLTEERIFIISHLKVFNS